MSTSYKKPSFVELARGATLNAELVKSTRVEVRHDPVKGRCRHYFVIDVYGGEHEVNRTRYLRVCSQFGWKVEA